MARQAPPPPPPSPPVRAMLDAARLRDGGRSRGHGGAGGIDDALTEAFEGGSRELRDALGEGRPVGELVGALARALGEAIARADVDDLRRSLEERVLQLLSHVVGAESGGTALRERTARAGLFEEARLAALAFGEPFEPGLKTLARTLADELDDGAPRRAATCLIAGIEREQWLELLRRELGEPRAVELPWFDDGRFGTVRVSWPRMARESRLQPGGAPLPAPRLSLDVELERLGPVHVEIALLPTRLVLRLVFARAAGLAAAQTHAAVLTERLGAGERDLRIEFGAAAGDIERGGPSGSPHMIEEFG